MSLDPTSSEAQTPIAQLVNRYNCCHRCDIITTIVAPILLAVAVSLTIYYAVHPLAPLVPIYDGFSISFPLLVCGSSGLALTILLIVQIARRGQVKIACGKCLGNTVQTSPQIQQATRKILHPGGRPNGQTVAQYQVENVDRLGWVTEELGQRVQFQTRDNLSLGGYWWRSEVQEAPTVIFFYGNQMTALDSMEMGMLYKNAGFNVLIFDLRGYGNSEGASAEANAELEAYYDAEAALKFVHSHGVDSTKIIAHGFSLGGAYAAALGYFFRVPYVILHNTFTNCAAVGSHVLKLGHEMIAPAFLSLYLPGSAPALAEFPNALDLQTDGFDTLSKVSRIRGTVLVIQSTNDHLMPVKFGNQLVQARYAEPKGQDLYLINVPGGHELYPVFQNDESLTMFNRFLTREFPSHPWDLRGVRGLS